MATYVPAGIPWPKQVRRLTRNQVMYLHHLNAIDAGPAYYRRYAEVLQYREVTANPPEFLASGEVAPGQENEAGWREGIEIPFDYLESPLV